jgi:hypothetical protein
MKEKCKKVQQHRRHIKEARRREIREMDELGMREYRRYVKEVEERKSEARKRERGQSEAEFDNYRRKYDHTTTNFATFYERQQEKDQEIEENLQYWDERMLKKQQASVMAQYDKVERAREITEKLRQK